MAINIPIITSLEDTGIKNAKAAFGDFKAAVGKAEGGITPGELGQRIAGAMEKQLLKAVSFDKLGKAAQQAGNAVGDAAGGVADQLKSLF
jgi:hypothetical protein